MVYSEKDNGGINLPAITIAGRNPQTQRGWRGPEIVNSIEDVCGYFDGPIAECINEKTYKQSETFHDVLVGSVRRESLLDTTNGISTEYGRAREGWYYTFNVTKSVGQADQIFIVLKYGFFH